MVAFPLFVSNRIDVAALFASDRLHGAALFGCNRLLKFWQVSSLSDHDECVVGFGSSDSELLPDGWPDGLMAAATVL